MELSILSQSGHRHIVTLPETSTIANLKTTLLEAWLADDTASAIDVAVEQQMQLLTNGLAWALEMISEQHTRNLPPIDLDYDEDDALPSTG